MTGAPRRNGYEAIGAERNHFIAVGVPPSKRSRIVPVERPREC